jgi:hypothetical protein
MPAVGAPVAARHGKDAMGYDWQPSQWVEDPNGHWRLIPGHWVAISPREMESAHARAR